MAEVAFDTLGAVDLGSNSFHLVIARVVHGELQVVDRLRESVRLAAGLGPDQRLAEDAQARALAALELFGQRLRDLAPGAVRAVGTSTLRKAKNSDSQEKLMIFTHLQKSPENVTDSDKLIVATGFEKLPKVQ